MRCRLWPKGKRCWAQQRFSCDLGFYSAKIDPMIFLWRINMPLSDKLQPIWKTPLFSMTATHQRHFWVVNFPQAPGATFDFGGTRAGVVFGLSMKLERTEQVSRNQHINQPTCWSLFEKKLQTNKVSSTKTTKNRATKSSNPKNSVCNTYVFDLHLPMERIRQRVSSSTPLSFLLLRLEFGPRFPCSVLQRLS